MSDSGPKRPIFRFTPEAMAEILGEDPLPKPAIIDSNYTGLIPYIENLGLGDLDSFLLNLKNEIGLLEGENGDSLDSLGAAKSSNGSMDTNQMYKACINESGGETKCFAIDPDKQKMSWITNLFTEIEKRLRPPLLSDGWLWGGERPAVAGHRLGRFYFSVYHPFAVEFWEEMFYLKQDLKRTGRNALYKMSYKKESFERGDCAVLYFSSNHQVQVYHLAYEMVSRHPEWFKENIPLFAAKIIDAKGRPFKGLSFGQNPGPSGTSFGYERAKALADSVRCIKKRQAAGKKQDRSDLLKAISDNFSWHKIDVNYPALNIGGIHIFKEIFQFTDQAQRVNI